MHPRLKPGRAPVVRSAGTLQLGQGHHPAVQVPADDASRIALRHLDGRRSRADLVAHLQEAHGIAPERTRDLLALLLAAGCLDDARAPAHALDLLPLDVRRRRLLDIDAWNAASTAPSVGQRRLARRRSAWVEIHGDGPLVIALSALLDEAGVGHVSVREGDGAPIGTSDVGLLGPTVEDIGAGTLSACRAAVERAAVDAGHRVPSPLPDGPPEVIVLVGRAGTDRAADAVRRGVVHLHLDDEHGHGVVGPLVVPGVSACGGCLVQQRIDADPTLGWAAPRTTNGLDAITRTAVAVLAAGQILQHLDGQVRPSCVGAVLRVPPDGGLARRRPVDPHPRCGCSWEVAPAA